MICRITLGYVVIVQDRSGYDTLVQVRKGYIVLCQVWSC